MTIIDFYKELSKILTDTREQFLSQQDGEQKLQKLLDKAESANLDIKISKSILDPVNLMRLDDEKSFRNPEDDDTSFEFDSDYESSF